MNELFCIILWSLIICSFGVCIAIGTARGFNRSLTRLIITVITVMLALFIAKWTTPLVLSSLSSVLIKLSNGSALITYLFSNAAGATTLSNLACAFIAPLWFLVIFASLNIIAIVVYNIIKKRFVYIKFKNEKCIASRISGIGLSVLMCFICISCFLTPLSYAANMSNSIGKLYNSSTSTLEILSSPTVKVFTDVPNRVIVPLLTSVRSKNGTKVSADTIVVQMADFIVSFSSAMSSNDKTSEQMYILADKLKECPVVDELLGIVVSDMANEPDLLGLLFNIDVKDSNEDSEVLIELLSGIKNGTTFSEVVTTAGNLNLTFSMFEDPTNISIIEMLFLHMDANAAAAFKEIVTDSIISLIGSIDTSVSGTYADMINHITTGVAAINSNTNLADAKRRSIIHDEAEAVSTVLCYINNKSDITVAEMLSAIKASDILTDTVIHITDNGKIYNPFKIARLATVDQAILALNNNNVASDNPLYNAFIALVTDPDYAYIDK